MAAAIVTSLQFEIIRTYKMKGRERALSSKVKSNNPVLPFYEYCKGEFGNVQKVVGL